MKSFILIAALLLAGCAKQVGEYQAEREIAMCDRLASEYFERATPPPAPGEPTPPQKLQFGKANGLSMDCIMARLKETQ